MSYKSPGNYLGAFFRACRREPRIRQQGQLERALNEVEDPIWHGGRGGFRRRKPTLVRCLVRVSVWAEPWCGVVCEVGHKFVQPSVIIRLASSIVVRTDFLSPGTEPRARHSAQVGDWLALVGLLQGAAVLRLAQLLLFRGSYQMAGIAVFDRSKIRSCVNSAYMWRLFLRFLRVSPNRHHKDIALRITGAGEGAAAVRFRSGLWLEQQHWQN